MSSASTIAQVAGLAGAFGVYPSYLLDRGEDPSVLDGDLIEGLRDETTRDITREVLRLPERERKIVLGVVREFGNQGRPLSG